ncbi:ATP-binding protein [Parachryseolinea silvisoli]|uniref:ATP-binding protein n=1 Tax=Parachryseolinea silvisoli TaxID=2873601 RepID=UPI002265A539|nr:ATP-binding protein [Parachryseolinea silvisoli]MCD9018563.1 GAF domain-containing protein [Parachryseolinea silvisoli]
MKKIKDIVNRDLVNLTNCESEPIHIPGSIQSHGFLLGVKQAPDFIIDFVSANAGEFIGVSPQRLLGQPLRTIFSDQPFQEFTDYLDHGAIDASQPFVFRTVQIPYNTTLHYSGPVLLLEFEPFPDGSQNLPDLYNQTRRFISLMEDASSLTDLCETIAAETRSITGYDRVMIYRFDKDYNGKVIAENKRDDLVPFLGHHYPHTDIPPQARALYLRNLLRIIADVHYTPVPILTLDDNTPDKNLDLSLSILRSISPIHIEYLQNMGVAATLTISLVQQKKLWGLIACHHYSPKTLPHFTRLSAQLQGHFLTSQLSVREIADSYELSQEVEANYQRLLPVLRHEHDFLTGLQHMPALLDLTHAEGVVIMSEGKLYSAGAVPPEPALRKLIHWLQETVQGELITARLHDLYPEADTIRDTAAGIICNSLVDTTQDLILWLRPEVEKTIDWAGNPAKAVLPNEQGVRLSPRKSFDLWRETVRNQSKEWHSVEIQAAARLTFSLQRQLLLSYLSREEARYRKLSEKLQDTNAELENIQWIGTHDLKEPLRKIQIFASRILSSSFDALPITVADPVGRMMNAANRMQSLLDDIMAYSLLTKNNENAFASCDLNQVIREVQHELKEELEEKKATLHTDTLPTLAAIPFQIRQLFFNLIANALKFSAPGKPPVIQIHYTRMAATETGVHRITLADNGIGFSQEHGEKIFQVFQRLHTQEKYAGTGIGLAICKKIMANHQGTIVATGHEDKGATFILEFPEIPAHRPF